MRLESSKHECVDRRTNQFATTHTRQERTSYRLKCPILSLFLGPRIARIQVIRFRPSRSRPLSDPARQGVSFRGVQSFALGRHLARLDTLPQQTCVGMRPARWPCRSRHRRSCAAPVVNRDGPAVPAPRRDSGNSASSESVAHRIRNRAESRRQTTSRSNDESTSTIRRAKLGDGQPCARPSGGGDTQAGKTTQVN